MMKKILRNHPEAVLTALAVVFAVLIVGAFSWGIGEVAGLVSATVGTNSANQQGVGFNLKAAEQLNLRGLVKSGQ